MSSTGTRGRIHRPATRSTPRTAFLTNSRQRGDGLGQARPTGLAAADPGLASEREALLALHACEREAHLVGDADALTASMAEFVWEASRGGLNRISRSEIRERFASYFKSVRYALWQDLQPAHVSIGADGLSAWMAVEIEAQMTATQDGGDQEVRFESSWIAVYEKVDDRWLMVGISSSVVD